jgi:hypothetical protein
LISMTESKHSSRKGEVLKTGITTESDTNPLSLFMSLTKAQRD